MKYKLVQEIDGKMIASEFVGDNIYAAMEIRGFEFDGFNEGCGQRAELKGQPKFKGVAGPMWDGDGIRYEDWKSYERLSA